MSKRGITPKKYLVLENIRSVHNVGSIFRTADAIGVEKIYLIGYTPAPLDRFGKVRSDLHKSALGAENEIKWENIKEENTVELLSKLKKEGIRIIALEQDVTSKNYKEINDFKNRNSVALVLGNEVEGVTDKILNVADQIMEIPMKGKKESLNVSVSAGIAMYAIFDI